ncbi:hypothetical protein N0V83_010207 [Neocucurbitaria cava]|uniref:Thioredoxin-like fold domain-containing protein n=1 Tax=Neocucurbitaria cava TaxID=798079 RepID=A0A9W9CHV9_9PLEO|nr:hypothetical protein N0V83_010207 [Neocucurbitaria cava]
MDSQSGHKLIVARGAHRAGKYVWSPFVTKLEFRFRLSKLPYENSAGGPLNGPRGKIPYVEVVTPGSPSEWVADTLLITKDFINRGLLQDMNSKLSGRERGQDLAIRALLEDKLFFYNIHERWIKNYYTMRDYTMAKVPFPQRYLFGYLAHRAVVKRLLDQGTGRFSDEEIHSFRKEIWAGMNGVLEESRRKSREGQCFWVLGGDEPTEADATMFGFAISALISDAGPVSRDLVKAECPAVVEYAKRIHQVYFPDYEVWG